MTEVLILFGLFALALYGFYCALKNSAYAVLKFAKEIKEHKNKTSGEVKDNGSD